MKRLHILKALVQGEPVDRTLCLPITMMFAAAYAGHSYRDYATRASVQAESQAQLAEDFELDHVGVLSDPAVEASDWGATVAYFDEQPPAIDERTPLIKEPEDLAKLSSPDPATGKRMSNRIEAVAELNRRVGSDLLVEGWVEGPCAESADLRGINTLMTDFFDDPEFVSALFERVVEVAIKFARLQIEAGADIIGVGDAAASLVGPAIYEEFVWPWEKKLIDAIHQAGGMTRLHICGNTNFALEKIGHLGCTVVDLDSMVDLRKARAAMPNQVLDGNLDPVRVVLQRSARDVLEALKQCHDQVGARYIAAAGCEIPRGTPPENLKAFSDFVRLPNTTAPRRKMGLDG
ncbi:MAG: uroporphyrinogen decarboxylase family protein [Methylacidiphilales bacterium]|nr:uroporphyrinogen decarboxylase family protein [Candidatus Methylacidiphilales bacterium]